MHMSAYLQLTEGPQWLNKGWQEGGRTGSENFSVSSLEIPSFPGTVPGRILWMVLRISSSIKIALPDQFCSCYMIFGTKPNI